VRWVDRRIGRTNSLLLGAVPILLLILLYLFLAVARNEINPADKILPLPGAMVDAMRALVFERDPLSGRSVSDWPFPPPARCWWGWSWGSCHPFAPPSACWSPGLQ
jgi:hypothetical protein